MCWEKALNIMFTKSMAGFEDDAPVVLMGTAGKGNMEARSVTLACFFGEVLPVSRRLFFLKGTRAATVLMAASLKGGLSGMSTSL
jgi:hypothetical protein